MKIFLIGLLLCIGTLALAQDAAASKIVTRISDNGSTLSIQIDGMRDGQKIHYDNTFDVENMNRLQKEILKYRVFASVGVPPSFRDTVWLIGLAFGFITLIMTLLIVRFQLKRLPSLPV